MSVLARDVVRCIRPYSLFRASSGCSLHRSFNLNRTRNQSISTPTHSWTTANGVQDCLTLHLHCLGITQESGPLRLFQQSLMQAYLTPRDFQCTARVSTPYLSLGMEGFWQAQEMVRNSYDWMMWKWLTATKVAWVDKKLFIWNFRPENLNAPDKVLTGHQVSDWLLCVPSI